MPVLHYGASRGVTAGDTGAGGRRVAPHPAQSFGERLRRFREAAGLTQEQLAERAGLTAKGIGALERGDRRHPQPHTVKALLTALELPDQERAELLAAIPKRPPSQAQAHVVAPN